MVNIRGVKESEISRLKDMWKSLAGEMEKYSDLNKLKDGIDKEVENGFRQKFNDENTRIFVLEDENNLIGYIMIELRENETQINDSSMKISDLYIEDKHRNSGYGTILIEKVENIAEKENIDYIRINSEWENKGARRLYEDLGFSPKKIGYSKKIY